MASPTFVFDTAIPQYNENRVFDHEYVARFPGATAWATLGECARQRGWNVMTADVFLRAPSATAVFVSEMVTPNSQELLGHKVIPAVILSGESPNVAWDFYHHLERYAGFYRQSFLFRGLIGRVQSPTRFHPLYWPNAIRNVLPGPKWREREFMVMVASNKQRFSISENKPLASFRRIAKRMIWNYLQLIDPLFRFEDLYQKRLNAICYFANVPGFQLYGTGWDKPGRMSKYLEAARRAGAAPIDDKLKAMTGFRFALCFENCVFPGYVTEKIFDSFFAGCIPVYWGAPDIRDFVPSETFVDASQFASWKDLYHYLKEMPESEAQCYSDAAINFLASEAFTKFHQDTFANELMGILETELANGL